MLIIIFYNKIRRNDHSFIKDGILHNGMCFKCELIRTHWLLQPFPPTFGTIYLELYAKTEMARTTIEMILYGIGWLGAG